MRRLRLPSMISLAIFAMLGQRVFAQQPDYTLGSSEARAESGWFFKRLFNAYRNEFLGQEVTESAPEPPRRALPSPWDSPPFPASEYQGYPLIGVPYSTTVYPLMEAIYGGPYGAYT